MNARVSGCLIELGFYYDQPGDADALARLIEYLDSTEARFSGEVAFSVGSEIRSQFYSVEAPEITYASNLGHAELHKLLWDADTKVLSIDMLNITGLVRRKSEIVTLPIHIERIPGCRNYPISILTEGLAFDFVRSTRGEKYARCAGARLRKKFVEIIASTNPAYAGISIEHALQPPEALRAASLPDFAPGDFYIRNEYVSRADFARLTAVVGQEFTRATDSGVFFYTNKYFHPENIGSRDLWEIREAATRILGRTKA